MNKICTTIKQSKKLVELGIDINTADMIHNILGESYVRHDTPIDKYHTPAWSLSALLELIPNCRVESLNPKYFNCPDVPWIVFDNGNHATENYNNPLDAAFEMVVWLKENNKL